MSEHDTDFTAWMEYGLGIDNLGYCATVIHDIDQDEALRRFGASDAQIYTATWADLLNRVDAENAIRGNHILAAFALGSHALLVEAFGYQGAQRPELSRGTFAVSTRCSINADSTFLVSRDGEVLATFEENCPGDAEGSGIEVLAEALSDMGIDDPRAFDEDEDSILEDLELLCRVAEVRPTMADVAGPARVALVPR
ncbi:DUF6461 domain-containing protein [Nocardia takedensis]|uniref:DUF6461 domain-containing protein n=1 Tax=Nocardia takedensis TaxID=259390 RepID=UPI003F763DA1